MLAVGSVLAVVVAVLGIRVARRARAEPSPLAGKVAGRRYGIIVGSEFAAVGAGAAILGSTGHAEFIAAWACFVVGVHFLPLSRVFPGIGMVGLAGGVVLVAFAALTIGLSTTILPSLVAGTGAGAFLLGHAASLLLSARHPRLPGTAQP